MGEATGILNANGHGPRYRAIKLVMPVIISGRVVCSSRQFIGTGGPRPDDSVIFGPSATTAPGGLWGDVRSTTRQKSHYPRPSPETRDPEDFLGQLLIRWGKHGRKRFLFPTETFRPTFSQSPRHPARILARFTAVNRPGGN